MKVLTVQELKQKLEKMCEEGRGHLPVFIPINEPNQPYGLMPVVNASWGVMGSFGDEISLVHPVKDLKVDE